MPDSAINRKQIYMQVSNLEVYATASVTQEWSLEAYGREIKGRPSPGDVAIKGEKDVLQIYLVQEFIDSKCPPYDLVEQLASFCGIKAGHKSLLLFILMQDNHEKIGGMLDQGGIPELTPYEDLPDTDDCQLGPSKGRRSLGPDQDGSQASTGQPGASVAIRFAHEYPNWRINSSWPTFR